MELFHDKADCCGCEACVNICAKAAIRMDVDECGYRFPVIDAERCVECGACAKVCPLQNEQKQNKSQEVYVAASNNTEQLMKSASGGIFAAIATHYLSKGGVVFGAALQVNNNEVVVEHIGITDVADLSRLQGSKYVQSHINNCFAQVKRELQSGREVLFSGTPCQCAGLKSYLHRPYDNLMVVDIICHGVPNQHFLNSYLTYCFPSDAGYADFVFRDKTKGWGLTAKLEYNNGISRLITAGTSSYYSLFLDAQIYRESCYVCKFAGSNRPGDLTLGDYWGIQKEHPELLGSGRYNVRNGISCILVNTSKGKALIETMKGHLTLDKSDYEKVAKRNDQLVRPSRKGKYREEILTVFQEYGYAAVDTFFKKHYRKQIVIHTILNKLPFGLKSFIQKMVH